MAEVAVDSIARSRRGTLFLVSTPIGNLGDLSPRARDTLRSADLLLAEDTRHTAQLLGACGIERPAGTLESLHEHNERERVPRVLARLAAGDSVALVSDAGTPLVSDPGMVLVREALRAAVPVVAVPGPCASIAALSVSGLPADRFAFEGFLPAKPALRRDVLQELARETRTLVFYEAPHRLHASLADMAACLGGDRPCAVLRELTKKFESAYRGTLAEIAQRAAADADMSRGEIVIVVQGVTGRQAADDEEAERVLRELVAELPASQAARLAARITGRARRQLYERAIAIAARRR